ncbi:MAG: hypothetical protein U5K37_06170 [Natrialbaceae archaeon]|nr:hypothetical protein [Natrialbaceae archaeon]
MQRYLHPDRRARLVGALTAGAADGSRVVMGPLLGPKQALLGWLPVALLVLIIAEVLAAGHRVIR